MPLLKLTVSFSYAGILSDSVHPISCAAWLSYANSITSISYGSVICTSARLLCGGRYAIELLKLKLLSEYPGYYCCPKFIGGSMLYWFSASIYSDYVFLSSFSSYLVSSFDCSRVCLSSNSSIGIDFYLFLQTQMTPIMNGIISTANMNTIITIIIIRFGMLKFDTISYSFNSSFCACAW